MTTPYVIPLTFMRNRHLTLMKRTMKEFARCIFNFLHSWQRIWDWISRGTWFYSLLICKQVSNTSKHYEGEEEASGRASNRSIQTILGIDHWVWIGIESYSFSRCVSAEEPVMKRKNIMVESIEEFTNILKNELGKN